MSIKQQFGRFFVFFKNAGFAVQLTIVVAVVAVVGGAVTAVAMVAGDDNAVLTSATIDSESSVNTVGGESQYSSDDDDEQTTEADAVAITPQSDEVAAQNNSTSNTAEDSPAPANPQEAQKPSLPELTYTDTYPFANGCTNNPQTTSAQLDAYGYTKCYSASYTAYKAAQTFGTIPQIWSDPKWWPAKADAANIPRGATPKLHAVGIQTSGGAGWSVWVEAVHDDDTIDISYYNWNNGLVYGTQHNVNSEAFSTYIYFGE